MQQPIELPGIALVPRSPSVITRCCESKSNIYIYFYLYLLMFGTYTYRFMYMCVLYACVWDLEFFAQTRCDPQHRDGNRPSNHDVDLSCGLELFVKIQHFETGFAHSKPQPTGAGQTPCWPGSSLRSLRPQAGSSWAWDVALMGFPRWYTG